MVVAAIALVMPATAVAREPYRSHRPHRANAHRRHRTRRHRHYGLRHLRADLGAISGTVYYVSASGSDSNSGTSPDGAWRTVGRVNAARLRPGDGVLFEGGQTFSDSTLMPGTSGAAGAPIVFGSYGNGQATITHGVWFIDTDYLTFDNLALGPQSGLQGGNASGHTANHIVVERSTIALGAGNSNLGIYANGNDWTIAGNVIEHTGDSGALLIGDDYAITGNTIADTGLDPAISYPKHGIYLKASNATVAGNTITDFSTDGVSVRYRNSAVRDNHISGGQIGIAWFQYDTIAGTSYWTNNVITNTTAAGIYVSPSDKAGPTIESFVITANTIRTLGRPINMAFTKGTVRISKNGS